MVKISNKKESNDFLIIIQTNETAEDCYLRVTEWLIKDCLNYLNDPIIFNPNYSNDDDFTDKETNKNIASNYDLDLKYSMRVVSGIYYNDYEDNNEEIHNELWFALHFDHQPKILFEHQKDEHGLIIINEEFKIPTISSEEILNILINEPDCIISVGVSGITSKFMKEIWFEIVSEGQLMETEAEGHLIHLMWIKDNNDMWIVKKEDSNKFGWTNYPPKDLSFPFPNLF